MRRLLFITLFFITLGFALEAQTDVSEVQKRRFYIEVVGTQTSPRSTSMDVTLNLGKLLTTRTGLTEGQLRKACRDLHFSGMVDAMNLLSINGWTLADTYAVSASGMTTIHWVVWKEVEDVLELLDGFVPRD